MIARLPLRKKTLQQLFIESRGRPVEIAGKQVIQMDRLPVIRGKLTVRAAQADAEQGVALETPRGEILLSDGGRTKLPVSDGLGDFDPGFKFEIAWA